MLTVRKLTSELLPRIRPIADASLAGEETLLRIGRTGFSLGYVPLPRAEWRTFPMSPQAAPERILQDPACCCFLAFDGDAFVGQCAVHVDADASWTHILDIRVDAAHRRQGVARALLTAMEDHARHSGTQGLHILVTDDNPAACQFCEHCGFTLAGLDRLALAYTAKEREKPLAQRACQLSFYQQLKKG